MNREQAEQIARNYFDPARDIEAAVDAIMQAVAIEREACAKVCETYEEMEEKLELEAYWAKVAHDVDHGINGMPKPDWKKILHLDWIVDCWKSELASRRSNPDTL